MSSQHEFIVVAASTLSLRCLRLPERDVVVVRPLGGVRGQVEGEILTVDVTKHWRFGHTNYVSGEITGRRIDGAILAPTPLELYDVGEADDGSGKHEYEMEQVIPGTDFSQSDYDPISESVESRDCGDYDTAFTLLQKCVEGDLRCIDAYVHLGLFRAGDFDSEWFVSDAIRSYQVAVAVADRTVGPDFDGLLPWICVDNRPLHRALQGLGICYWRLGDIDSACRTFARLASIDLSDPLDGQFLMGRARSGETYLEFRREMGRRSVRRW